MSINHENQYKNERESRWELAKEEEIERNKKIALKMGLMVEIVNENPYAYHINDY